MDHRSKKKIVESFKNDQFKIRFDIYMTMFDWQQRGNNNTENDFKHYWKFYNM